jgi:hypothetical protein
MGEHRPSAINNLLMALLVAVSVYLTGKNAAEWWQRLAG